MTNQSSPMSEILPWCCYSIMIIHGVSGVLFLLLEALWWQHRITKVQSSLCEDGTKFLLAMKANKWWGGQNQQVLHFAHGIKFGDMFIQEGDDRPSFITMVSGMDLFIITTFYEFTTLWINILNSRLSTCCLWGSVICLFVVHLTLVLCRAS